LAGQQVDQRRTSAAVGDLCDFNAELLEDQHLGQMTKGTDAGMTNLRAGRKSPIECSSVHYGTVEAANRAGNEALKQLLTEFPA
jgi:hypothetical protein